MEVQLGEKEEYVHECFFCPMPCPIVQKEKNKKKKKKKDIQNNPEDKK